jgi:basic membrane lipoprotein Med (substrate-binding protein (PBP1-ABC) superfamily)
MHRTVLSPRVVIATLVLACAIALVWLGPPAGQAAGKKMAMILPGSIQDADFNAIGYVALQEVGKSLDVQVAHSESVAVADAERVAREYINAGYDILAFHGGQFPTIMKKLAAQFPNVVFITESSGPLPETPANGWVLGRKWHPGYYALGTLAALSTKTGKVGFVGGVRIPDVIASTNAVFQALKDHNPKAQLVWNHTGDFNDGVKNRQTAEAQIAAGADFIVTFVNLGVYGVAEAAKASSRPVLLTTFMTDKWDVAPKNFAGSLLANFIVPYKSIVERILKGERTGYYEMKPGSGMEFSEPRNVPAEAAAKAKAVFKEVSTGRTIPEITDKVLAP